MAEKATPPMRTALPAIKEMMKYRDSEIATQIRRIAMQEAGLQWDARVLDTTNAQMSRFMGIQDELRRSHKLEPCNTETELRDIAVLARQDPEGKFFDEYKPLRRQR